MDRYEELMCDGENPRTTLVVLRSEAPLAAESVEDCAECVEELSAIIGVLSTTISGVDGRGADC